MQIDYEKLKKIQIQKIKQYNQLLSQVLWSIGILSD